MRRVRNALAGLVGVAVTATLGLTIAPPAGVGHAAPLAGVDADADVQSDAGAQTDTGDIVFSVPSGTFQGEVSVALSTAISNAQIRYTTDNQPPQASSPLYSGTPLRLTRTTQLRAQAFVNGAASGAPGTSLYLARSIDATHDLPVLVLDDYGQGAPGREYVDVAVMEFQPVGGAARLSATPRIASRAGFHLRGNSSATFPKVPYRLELRGNDDDDADYPLLGLPEDSDWVMRGPYTDKALIRDAFAYGLGRDMGIYAPRFAFAEVYVNLDAQPLAAADYQGVYLIVESVKNSANRLDLKQLDEDDTTLPKITGGYIFKFEWMAAEEPILPCTGPAATCWNYLEVVDPSPLNDPQRAWLTQHLQQFNDLLNSPNFAHPETGYSAWIDVDSWINQLIISELTREMDSYVRSAHFYKDRDTKIFAGPLWDFDLSFGVGGYFNNNQTSGWQYQQTRSPQTNNWFARLLQDPVFVNRVKVRWQSLRRGLLSDAQLEARINSLTTPLTNAAQRNFQKWPNLSTRMLGPFITPTNPTWQGQVQFMRDWMFQRAAWLDSTAAWGGTTSPTPPPATATPTPPPATATPTPRPTTPAPTTPPAATTPPVPTTPPVNPGRTCTATYSVVGQWPGGFQGNVRVTAGSSAISGWRVNWTFGNGQSVSNFWEATITTSGSSVTASNVAHNGSLAAGASATFGFLGSWNGTNSVPSLTCTAS